MNFKRFKHALLRLSLEEKVIGIGVILVLVSSFLPWYKEKTVLQETGTIINGLEGDLGVIGFVIFLMSLMSLIFLIAEQLHIRLPQFGYNKEQIILFFMGESAFLSLLSIAIYMVRSIDVTEAGPRYGIGLVLAGSIFAAFAAFSLIKKNGKKENQAFFGEDDPMQTDQYGLQDEEQGLEEEDIGENQDHHALGTNENERLQEEIVEDEEDVSIVEQTNTTKADQTYQQKNDTDKKSYPEQGSFFNREAGL